jgi:hypothetical protein
MSTVDAANEGPLTQPSLQDAFLPFQLSITCVLMLQNLYIGAACTLHILVRTGIVAAPRKNRIHYEDLGHPSGSAWFDHFESINATIRSIFPCNISLIEGS